MFGRNQSRRGVRQRAAENLQELLGEQQAARAKISEANRIGWYNKETRDSVTERNRQLPGLIRDARRRAGR